MLLGGALITAWPLFQNCQLKSIGIARYRTNINSQGGTAPTERFLGTLAHALLGANIVIVRNSAISAHGPFFKSLLCFEPLTC
jgi:hypothetical protein